MLKITVLLIVSVKKSMHLENINCPLSPSFSKLRHIVDEMVTTEREYVRSLRYIIDNYFPEMERADLPQDLRGKRSVIFGNLEKLVDFHSQYFLKELESCCNHPLRVSHCFLRHVRESLQSQSFHSNSTCRTAWLQICFSSIQQSIRFNCACIFWTLLIFSVLIEITIKCHKLNYIFIGDETKGLNLSVLVCSQSMTDSFLTQHKYKTISFHPL